MAGLYLLPSGGEAVRLGCINDAAGLAAGLAHALGSHVALVWPPEGQPIGASLVSALAPAATEGPKEGDANMGDATDAGSAGSSEAPDGWQEYLEQVPILAASRATDVLHVARGRLGRKAAGQLFPRRMQTVLRGDDGKNRRVFKQGCPRGLAWRLKA